MKFVKIVLCAVFWHMLYVEGLKLELFLNPNPTEQSEFECCLDRFEDDLAKFKIKQKSVVVVLLNTGDGPQNEPTSTRNALRPNPWSIEVWQHQNYLKSQLSGKPFPTGHNYILIGTGLTGEITEAQLTEFRSNLPRLSNVCIGKIISKNNRNSKHPKRSSRCTILNVSDSQKKSAVSLHAAGMALVPFAYYDESKGEMKGIDVSLITTLAEKLELTLSLDVLETNKSENAHQSGIGFLNNR